MAVIPLPKTIRFASSIAWQLDRPAQINVSGYTGRRQVVANPWHGKWRAKVELAPIVGENNVLAWRAFLAALRGQINTFRLPMAEGPQNNNSGVTVESGHAAGTNTIILANLSTALEPGQFVQIGDLSLCLTSVGAWVAGGRQAITFEPPMRLPVVAGMPAETANPACHVALASSSTGWSVDKGKVYGISLEVEEAY